MTVWRSISAPGNDMSIQVAIPDSKTPDYPPINLYRFRCKTLYQVRQEVETVVFMFAKSMTRRALEEPVRRKILLRGLWEVGACEEHEILGACKKHDVPMAFRPMHVRLGSMRATCEGGAWREAMQREEHWQGGLGLARFCVMELMSREEHVRNIYRGRSNVRIQYYFSF